MADVEDKLEESIEESQIPAPDAQEIPEAKVGRISVDDADEDTSSVVVADWITPSLEEPTLNFEEVGLLEPIIQAIQEQGWANPTPVQQLCLPATIVGKDVAGFAQTGTGKTGVFVITVAQRLLQARAAQAKPSETQDKASYPFAVVLAPTRELAMQIEDDAQAIFKRAGITSLAVYGGSDYAKQLRDLKDGIDVIVATPGRLMDYCRKGEVKLDRCSVFVCDEADRMFDMGFIDDVQFFLDRLPEGCQKLLFSATTNENVKELAFEYLEQPVYVSVTPEAITPERIEQHSIVCNARHKLKVLLGLLRDHNPECAIIFTNTKLVADWLHYKLVHNGIDADLITGDLPQRKRIALIQRIKEGKIKALIATDVASRGLHISRVSHVYNFDLPDEAANYVHRIGRTARAGARGAAYSLVCEDYGQNLEAINLLLGESLALHPIWYDEKYLQIEDKAGNPFADADRASAEASGGGEGRQDRGGGRGPRDNRSGGRGPRDNRSGGRGEGRSDGRGGGRSGGRDRPERDGSGPSRGRGPQDGQGRRGGQGQQGDRPQQARPQHERDDSRRGGRGRGRGRDRQGEHSGQRHGQGGDRHGQRQQHGHHASQHSRHLPAPVSKPQGFLATIKRIFAVIFGGGKSDKN